MVSIHAFRGEGDDIAAHRGIERLAVSIHAFRGEGDRCYRKRITPLVAVSIHAFRGEGDVNPDKLPQRPGEFQSTPSGGKATGRDHYKQRARQVSIHAFRGEGDRTDLQTDAAGLGSFNPRLPGGRRPGIAGSVVMGNKFQSTPSGGTATFRRDSAFAAKKFQSTPSGGKATTHHTSQNPASQVSIHAFRGEGDPSSTLPV